MKVTSSILTCIMLTDPYHFIMTFFQDGRYNLQSGVSLDKENENFVIGLVYKKIRLHLSAQNQA